MKNSLDDFDMFMIRLIFLHLWDHKNRLVQTPVFAKLPPSLCYVFLCGPTLFSGLPVAALTKPTSIVPNGSFSFTSFHLEVQIILIIKLLNDFFVRHASTSGKS